MPWSSKRFTANKHILRWAFNSTSRHLDDLLNIDNTHQLNKANSSDTEAPFLDLYLNISDGFVSSKIYDKRDDFDIANFPFLHGDIPRAPSYGVYIPYTYSVC